jgi:hypothetical protein
MLHPERPERIEKIGHHLYRVKMRSKLELLNNTFIGAGSTGNRADEKPFEHLPFESFLAISVLRYEMFQHPKVFSGRGQGAILHPGRSGTTYTGADGCRTNEHYIGFLMDWKHRLTEEPVAGSRTCNPDSPTTCWSGSVGSRSGSTRRGWKGNSTRTDGSAPQWRSTRW